MSNTITPRAQRLRDAGYKLTNARMAVLEVLEHSGGHLTSAQILDAVAEKDSGIGRASVFRTLDLLTNMAIIRPTYIDSSLTPTYVMLPDGHHHHIVCTRCNRVIEFDDCELEVLSHKLEDLYHIKLTGHLLEFYGTCEDCEQPISDEPEQQL